MNSTKQRIVRIWLVLALLAGTLPLIAADEPPLPADLPPYGALKPFQAPQVTAYTLPNGLTVWLAPRSGYPKVAFALAVRAGMSYDPADRPGFAQFITDVLNGGTKTRSARQIAEELQATGSDFSAAAYADSIQLRVRPLSSKADAALAVLSDIAQNSTFPDDEVELSRRNLGDQLRANESNPQWLATRALARAVFGDHPYGTMSATQASLAAVKADDLRREFARRFRPDKSVLVAVGDFDPQKMRASIEASFGKWAAPAGAAPPDPAVPTVQSPHALFFVPRAGSVQTTLLLAAFGPRRQDPDAPAAQVADAIYGNMFGSRMVRNVREDKGYSYSPYSYIQNRRLAGVLYTQADVRNEVTGPSYNELQYELNRMATTTPTDDEVQRAQRYLVGNRAISLQSQASLSTQLATLWIYGLPPDYLGTENERVTKVTPADVAAVGRKYYAAGRSTVVAVGEEKVVGDQLNIFGLEKKPGFAPE